MINIKVSELRDWYPTINMDRFHRIVNNRKFIKRMNKDLKRRGRI